VSWLVVDAMNVVGSRPDGWWRDRRGAVEALLAEVRAAAPNLPHHRITVVVDGRGEDQAPDPAGVEVRWAPGGANAADDRIVALLEAADQPATVVTADRDLRDRVTALGASVEGPRSFRSMLADRGA
jgi:hypothetical protein